MVCFDPLLDQLWLIEAQNPGRVHSFIARSPTGTTKQSRLNLDRHAPPRCALRVARDLDKNPATEPNQWNKQAIRDLYLEQFPQTQKVRSLTEGEKKAVDKFVDNLITTLLTKGN